MSESRVAATSDPSAGPRLVEPSGQAQWEQALALVDAYAASLSVSLCFQDFDRERLELPRRYGPPEGAFFLALDTHDEPLGCVALRRLGPRDAEMKRLFVLPRARGLGLGERLVALVVDRARALGCTRLLLDTLPEMRAAQRLYERVGFVDVAPYADNPVPGARFMALAVSAQTAPG